MSHAKRHMNYVGKVVQYVIFTLAVIIYVNDYDPFFELSILKLEKDPCYHKDLVCREVCLNGKRKKNF